MMLQFSDKCIKNKLFNVVKFVNEVNKFSF